MATQIDVVGTSEAALFGEQNPKDEDVIKFSDDVELVYKSTAAKSFETDLLCLMLEFSAEFSKYVVFAELYQTLKNSGADALRINGKRVDMDNEEGVKAALDEAFEDTDD